MSQASPSPMIRAITRVGTLLHAAHAQDFERRRKPELGKTAEGEDMEDEDDDSDEDNDNGTTVGEDERDGTLERMNGNGKAAKPTAEEDGAGNTSGDEEGEASSASDDQAIARARKLRQAE